MEYVQLPDHLVEQVHYRRQWVGKVDGGQNELYSSQKLKISHSTSEAILIVCMTEVVSNSTSKD